LLRGTPGVRVIDASSVYETEPVGEVLDQRDFFNAVLRVETELDPHELLSLCKRIEAELGRRPGGPTGGPRPIDVDVLLVGELTISDGRLVVPHPEVTRRRFVLVPLLELEPALTLPRGTSLSEALAELGSGQQVTAVASLSR
jgi:2-amino-4-hydroxy-6-hydroxymethyldihydropteridine diphosphokinase